jgi:hypothetical protein
MNFRSQTLTSRRSALASCVLSEPSSALYGKVERSQRGNEFVPSEDDDETPSEAIIITHTARNCMHQLQHRYSQAIFIYHLRFSESFQFMHVVCFIIHENSNLKITELCWNYSQGDEEFITFEIMDYFLENIQIY